MIREPEIVVIQKGDVASLRAPEPFIIGYGLITCVLREVVEMDPRIAELPYDFFRVIGARVADHPHLPIRQSLGNHRLDRVPQNVRAIVRSSNYRDERGADQIQVYPAAILRGARWSDPI